MLSMGYNTEVCLFNYDGENINIFLLQEDSGSRYLPGTLISENTPANIVVEELLKDKLNIEFEFMRHFAVFDAPERDYRGRIISNLFYVITRQKSDFFVPINDIDNFIIEYDHLEIVTKAIENLKKDLLETLIAKYFLPQEFTIRELQELLMCATDSKQITRTHFYTKIKTKKFIKPVIDDGIHRTRLVSGAKKPSKLYYIDDERFVSSVYF